MYYDDSQLVKLIIKGDFSAFKEIYERYHRSLFYMAVRYLKDKDKAEDALQDIFVKLWENRYKLDPNKSLKNYLFVMLKHRIINIIRNKKNQQLVDHEFNENDYLEQLDVWDEVIYSEQKHIIDKGLMELSDMRRRVFKFKVIQGFSNEEIADQLSISVNTVKVHYYHALKFIREYIKRNSHS